MQRTGKRTEVKREINHLNSKFGFLLKTKAFPIFCLNETNNSVFATKSKQISIFVLVVGKIFKEV